MVRQNYITVHSYTTPQRDAVHAFETDGNGNGLAILEPTTCTITEELNGTYELYLEHPLDEDGKWKLLEIDNIIKANGQLFRIKKRNTKLNSSGEKVRTVYAMHIFYDLADKNLNDYTAGYWTAYWLVYNLFRELENVKMLDNNGGENQDDLNWYKEYDFNHKADGNRMWNTDLNPNPDSSYDNSGIGYASFKSVNMVSALIGTENSVTNIYSKHDAEGNVYTPELYRDNFYFSFCWEKENSQKNAFSITHKVDMVDVEETYDASSIYTHIYARDGRGNLYTDRLEMQEGVRIPPHAHIKQVEFQYNDSEWSLSRFRQDAARYFRTINKPKLTLTCNYAELSNTDLYKDYIAAKHCNVGDSGTIDAVDLGIKQTMKVIKKKIDLINPENVEITFGSKLACITESTYMAQTINKSKFTNTDFFSVETSQGG